MYSDGTQFYQSGQNYPNWTFLWLHPFPPGKRQDGILNLDKTVPFNNLPKLIFHYHPVILQYSVCVTDDIIKWTKNYKIKITWLWIIYYWLYKTELNSVNKTSVAVINIKSSVLAPLIWQMLRHTLEDSRLLVYDAVLLSVNTTSYPEDINLHT